MNLYELTLVKRYMNGYWLILKILLYDIYPMSKDEPAYTNIEKVIRDLGSKGHSKLPSQGNCFKLVELIVALKEHNLDNDELSNYNSIKLFIKLLLNSSILDVSEFDRQVYCVNKDFAKYFKSLKAVQAYTCGFSAIAEHYSNSVFAIEVEVENGDLSIGTGYYFAYRDENQVNHIIITNKHVIENKIIRRVISKSEQNIGFDKVIYNENDIDLAAIVLNNEQELSCDSLDFSDEQGLLDEVITLGYPDVPNRLNLSMLAQRGDINGTIKTRHSNVELLVISAKTSPGNSGGPVINQFGKVVGIVTKSSESKKLNEEGAVDFDRFFFAIRTKDIIDFLNDKIIPTLNQS